MIHNGVKCNEKHNWVSVLRLEHQQQQLLTKNVFVYLTWSNKTKKNHHMLRQLMINIQSTPNFYCLKYLYIRRSFRT